MRLLFVHPSAPGQFADLALWLQDAGWDVRFLTAGEDGEEAGLPFYGWGPWPALDPALARPLRTWSRALTFARAAAARLARVDWTPDLVVSHLGSGCVQHLRAVTAAPIAGYVEYGLAEAEDTSPTDFRGRVWDPDLRDARRAFAAVVSADLACCDAATCPLPWQRATLPGPWRDRVHLLPDPVDEQVFTPGRRTSFQGGFTGRPQIGRASCRERVCQYV